MTHRRVLPLMAVVALGLGACGVGSGSTDRALPPLTNESTTTSTTTSTPGSTTTTVACDDPTVFYQVRIAEIGGKGKRW